MKYKIGKKGLRGRRKNYKSTKKNLRKAPAGILKAMRWSSKDSTNNCHVLIQGNDAVPSNNNAITFMLADTAAYNEAVALFDNYRITRVMYRWVVTRSPDWNSTTANRGWSIRIVWGHDFNDSTPVSMSQLYQRSGIREAYLNTDRLTTKWYSLKPASLGNMYETTGATAYSPKWLQWVDTADYSMTHYGIKYAYDNLYTGCNLRLEAKIYCEFKGIS